MAKGISIESGQSDLGQDVYLIKKSRGKLSVDEITEFLQRENNGFYQGLYIIVVNATESATGGSGWYPDEPSTGDEVEVFQLVGEEHCPACSRLIPPDYCPECGVTLKLTKVVD